MNEKTEEKNHKSSMERVVGGAYILLIFFAFTWLFLNAIFVTLRH